MGNTITYRTQGVRAMLATLLLAFALGLVAVAAPAQEAYAADSGSITLNYTGSDTEAPIPYMAVYLFEIASIDGDNYKLTGSFTGYKDIILGWDGKVKSDAAWLQQTADLLDGLVRASAPDPTGFKTTDADGTIVFDGLENGLYLVLEAGDGVHKFSASLINVGGAEGKDIVAKPKNEVPFNPVTEVKVVKHWAGDTGSESARPESIKVQLYCDNEKYGDVVELSDKNAWTNTWTSLDASVTHKWNVVEVDPPSGYAITVSEDNGNFTITNTKGGTEVIISKQEVGGGPELPGAKLTIKDADGNVVDEWISGTTPHKVVLAPGVYTLTEVSAPNGYEIAETITFRVNEDGTTEVLQDGKWVDCANHVVMYDAPSTTTSKPPTTTTTPNPPTTTTTTVTGKLPQTGQLWWPVPVLFCAGLVAIGAGRIISTRSRAR